MRHILAAVLTLVSLAAARAGDAPPLEATGDFSNGNAKIVAVDEAKSHITIEPVDKGGRNIWWHVRITGLREGQVVTLAVDKLARIAGDAEPVISFDGQTWERLAAKSSPFTFTAKGSSATIARNIPYPYEHATKLAADLKDNPHVVATDLCKSEKDRAVPLLRISDQRQLAAGQKIIWVMARQHAFESHASWVADALARWAAGDSEEAKTFRTTFVLYVVPVMDVDSVAIGAGGKDQDPDFNRVWNQHPAPWRGVEAAQKLLSDAIKDRPLIAFFDVHDPWFYEGGQWYLPDDRTDEPPPFKAFLKHYTQALARAENTPATFIKPKAQPPKNMTSRAWAAARVDAHGIVATMEVSHLRDNSGRYITLPGLQAFGQQLGRSLLATLNK